MSDGKEIQTGNIQPFSWPQSQRSCFFCVCLLCFSLYKSPQHFSNITVVLKESHLFLSSIGAKPWGVGSFQFSHLVSINCCTRVGDALEIKQCRNHRCLCWKPGACHPPLLENHSSSGALLLESHWRAPAKCCPTLPGPVPLEQPPFTSHHFNFF